MNASRHEGMICPQPAAAGVHVYFHPDEQRCTRDICRARSWHNYNAPLQHYQHRHGPRISSSSSRTSNKGGRSNHQSGRSYTICIPHQMVAAVAARRAASSWACLSVASSARWLHASNSLLTVGITGTNCLTNTEQFLQVCMALHAEVSAVHRGGAAFAGRAECATSCSCTAACT